MYCTFSTYVIDQCVLQQHTVVIIYKSSTDVITQRYISSLLRHIYAISAQSDSLYRTFMDYN